MENLEAAQMMSIVVVGHVDHGKSTVIGRLLADTGILPQGKLEQVMKACERNGRPFEYAYLIDALKDEQAQGITIEVARVFFKSSRRYYLINDAPGHVEFLKNMVTGASRAEAALLVIDGQEGVRENSRLHGYLLWMLGIKKVIVLVSKMDLVGFNQEVYDKIVSEYSAFLSAIGLQPKYFIPVSGSNGDNISHLSTNMPWYRGATVLSGLDEFESDPPLLDKPFRMPVQDVYKFSWLGDNRRIIAGSVSSGSIRVGDELVFYPSGKRSTLTSIEAFNRPSQTLIEYGQPAGLCVGEQLYIPRGEIATRAEQQPPKVTTRLRVSLFWLGKEPMRVGGEYILKLAAAQSKVKIEKIRQIIDASQADLAINDEQSGEINAIKRHQVAECTLKLSKAIAFDLAAELKDTSRFVIVNNHEICGGGIVLEDLVDSEKWARDLTLERNSKWIKSLLTSEERADHYNQRASLVLITGEREVGRKRIANQLETNLFNSGKFVYFLGIGSVIHGVDADIKDKDPEVFHQEHIRRMAEVIHILLDAGLILIVTAIKLTQSDLELIKTVIDGNSIQVVWVGDSVTTDLAFDLKVPGMDQIDQSVVRIKQLLYKKGVIFKP
ncbi:MAG: GTP-binding protein [Chloroflexi bacterium]|nr:GTP-binding protein [Chloroflexota bacterium]